MRRNLQQIVALRDSRLVEKYPKNNQDRRGAPVLVLLF